MTPTKTFTSALVAVAPFVLVSLLCTQARAQSVTTDTDEEVVATKPGLLKGTVVSSETSAPIGDVLVTAERGAKRRTTKTDLRGKFELELAPGSYRLVFFHPQFNERTFYSVEVHGGRVNETEIELEPGTGQRAEDLEEIVVTGKYLENAVEQERFSDSVIDMLGSEDWQVTGDSDVTDALSRVTGVTIVDDKFVYIRGLGERYAATLFNNALLPSPDPARRVVPLDLFPSGVMKQLSIQKTYAPNLPADFSGGSLQMTTKDIPTDSFGNVSVSIDYNTETTFQNRRWYKGDSADWTGFEGGFRHFPHTVEELSVNGRLPPPSLLTPEQIREVGLAINREYDEETKTIPPDVGLDGSYGNTYESRIGDFGFLLGGRYKNEWEYTKEDRRETENGANGPQVKDDFVQRETVNTVKYAALGVGEWAMSDTQIFKFTGFYTRVTDKRYIRERGLLGENERFVENTIYEWEARQLWSLQLVGDHMFPDYAQLAVDWGVTYSQATRDKPDSRFYQYERNESTGEFTFANEPSGNSRQWEDLKDDAWDAFLDNEIPIAISDDILTTLSMGGKFFDKKRNSDLRKFRFNWRGTSAQFNEISDGTPTEVFSDPNIGDNLWEFEETTQNTDSYDAKERIAAGYFQTDTDFFVNWRLMAGFRYEWSDQETSTREIQGGGDLTNKLEKGYILPAVTLTWAFRDDMQLRGAFSQTINRPDLREISRACYLDAEDRDVLCGNAGQFGFPKLEIAEIKNYDLRWEWYYGDENNVSIAGFYKDLKKPIEETLLLQGGSGTLRTYANADDGYLYGFELAMRQDLELFGDWGRDFYFKFNGAIIDSEVSRLDPQSGGSKKGELQGQSPWIVNYQMTYDNLLRDFQATLAFNMFGKRITDIGTRGLPDAKEEPAPRLDFNMLHGFELFDQYMTVQFKVENIINPDFEVKRGGVTERKFKTGPTFKLGLDVEF